MPSIRKPGLTHEHPARILTTVRVCRAVNSASVVALDTNLGTSERACIGRFAGRRSCRECAGGRSAEHVQQAQSVSAMLWRGIPIAPEPQCCFRSKSGSCVRCRAEAHCESARSDTSMARDRLEVTPSQRVMPWQGQRATSPRPRHIATGGALGLANVAFGRRMWWGAGPSIGDGRLGTPKDGGCRGGRAGRIRDAFARVASLTPQRRCNVGARARREARNPQPRSRREAGSSRFPHLESLGSGRHRKDLRTVRIAFIYCNAAPTWSYVGLDERTDTAGSRLFAEIRCPYHFMVEAISLLGIGVPRVSRDSGRVRHDATHASRKLAASVSVDRRSASPRRASPTFRRMAEWHRGPISRRALGPTTPPHPVRRHPTGASAVFRQAPAVSCRRLKIIL